MKNVEKKSGMQAKEDQRVRITKTMIRDAFIGLLSQKSLQNITVKELCESAQVSRGTFYLHYLDIYDLLEKVENEMLEDLEMMLSNIPIISTSSPPEAVNAFLGPIYGFFERNKEMCAILLGDNGDKKFVARIIETGRQKSVKEYKKMYPSASQAQVEVFYYFIAWGFIGLIQQSLQQGNKIQFDTMMAEAQAIIAESVGYFDNKKP
jgi:AcrR family transcriptional regulator